MSSDLEEKKQELSLAVAKQTSQFLEANAKWRTGDFDGAVEIIEGSILPESTKGQLLKVLNAKDTYICGKIFWEYEMRLGNALCQSCWNTR
jgi:hypothetical protein